VPHRNEDLLQAKANAQRNGFLGAPKSAKGNFLGGGGLKNKKGDQGGRSTKEGNAKIGRIKMKGQKRQILRQAPV